MNLAGKSHRPVNDGGTNVTNQDISGYALLAGRSGGQTLNGGTASGDDLTLNSTTDVTKGDILLGATGKFQETAGDLLTAGYGRIGSLTAPANTTAGDLTVGRINIGDSASAFPGTYQVLRLLATNSETGSGANVGFNFSYTANPATNSSKQHRALLFTMAAEGAAGATQDQLFASRFELRNRQDGLITSQVGQIMVPMVTDDSSPATVQATNVTGLALSGIIRPAGTSTVTVTNLTYLDLAGLSGTALIQGVPTVTNSTGVKIGDPTAGTITNLYGIDIGRLSRGSTVNYGIRLAMPGIRLGAVTNTDVIGLVMPSSSSVLGNQTQTSANVHGVSLGIQTFTSTTNVRTVTNMANLYIAGAPVASTNVTVTNGPYSIWVDGGTTRLDGDLDHRGTNLGFFGVTPTTRPTELTDELTTITHTAPGTPDYAIQNLTDVAPFGFATQDEGNTVLSVIANLQTRVNELETKLTSLGLLQDAD